MAVFKARGLSRSYHQGHKTIEVLKNIDLDVSSGELVGLVGASGSGKSTLLQVAGLLDSDFTGKIELVGTPVSDMNDEERTRLRLKKLGFVYQFHHLLPDFTAQENVALALTVGGGKTNTAQENARELLTDLGLKDRLDHTPARLSGGEQQRVAIARAIIGKPALLLADEPTGNLDEETAARVLELLLKTVRERGLSAVIATHDKELAAKLDRQLQLSDGHVSEL